jgi:hypothetical protein
MWKKRKKERPDGHEMIRDKAASGIARVIDGAQRRFGETLNSKTENLSQRGKMILLVAFCSVFGGGSLYIMIEGLHSAQAPSEILKSNPITVPRHVDKTGEGIRAFITAEDIRRIKLFRRYMDSLKNTNKGLLIHDSIIRVRPGLMDSLIEVERLYGIDSAAKN